MAAKPKDPPPEQTALDHLPHSSEMEMSALGAMILSESAAKDLARTLDPLDFYIHAHKEMFKALAHMAASDSPIDLVTLKDELQARGKLDACGGEDYLIQTAAFVPSAASAAYYAGIVKEKSARRRYIFAGRKMIAEALDEEAGADPIELALTFRERINRIPLPSGGPKATLEGISLNGAFKMVEVKHLSNPYLVYGKPHLFDADGGVGKTSFIAGLMAGFTNGRDILLNKPLESGPVRCAYFHKGEDTNDELETVFRANGGDSTYMTWFLQRDLILNPQGIELVGNTLIDGKYLFCCFDAFFYFLGGLMKSTNDNLPVMSVMEGMLAMYDQTGACGVHARHTVKGTIDKEASNLGMGSAQFRNSHRGQLVLRHDPDDPTDNPRTIVVDKKGSMLNLRGKPFAFRRTGIYGAIEICQEEVADPFISPEQQMYKKAKAAGRPADDRERCKTWTLQHIKTDACEVNSIFERAQDAGFTRATFFRAKKELLEEEAISTRNQPRTGTRPAVWIALDAYDWTALEEEWNPDPFADE
jgi:hypothetical protein